jgi:hypothetical protein
VHDARRMSHKPEDIARWMGNLILVRRETLSEPHAARVIRVLFGAEHVSPKGTHVAKPVREALRALFPKQLKWERESRRWSSRAGRKHKRTHVPAARSLRAGTRAFEK